MVEESRSDVGCKSHSTTLTVHTGPFTMLDAFEVVTSSGIVLWSKSYAAISPGLINSFIREVFIEETVAVSAAKDASSSSNPTYRKDKYALKWTTFKDLGLIFIV